MAAPWLKYWQRKVLPIQWVIDILEQVCSAVEEAHRAGIIHRDLKPDNIWLEPNRRGGYTVKVLDFGLVKLGGPDQALNTPEIRSRSSIDEGLPVPEAETVLHSTSEASTLLKVSERNLDQAFEPLKAPVEHNGRRSSDPSLKGRTTQQQLKDENLTRLGSVMGTPFYFSSLRQRSLWWSNSWLRLCGRCESEQPLRL